ncbi:MAG: hypothetical protein ACYDAG_03980 [Chloroflexota bacterium]
MAGKSAPRPAGQPGRAGKRGRGKPASRPAGRAGKRGSPRLWPTFVVVAALALALAVGLSRTLAGARTGAPAPSSGSDLLGPAPGLSSHPTVDGIPCLGSEQVSYHVHAHLAVYVNGQPRTVPQGIGIAGPRKTQNSSEGPFVVAGSCFYWLHTHTPDGVIHIESPRKQAFTLGQFFDIWHQPLSPSQVGPAKGRVRAYVDGKPYQGDPRSIPLVDHSVIQLDVGSGAPPPQPFTFPSGL